MGLICRNGVKADDKMHAVLMAAVGSSDLSQAIKLKQELADKHIMRPQVTSHLFTALIGHFKTAIRN